MNKTTRTNSARLAYNQSPPPMLFNFLVRVACFRHVCHQSTTSSKQNWVWSYETTLEAAFLQVEVAINKFEYTSIEEVDPVDGWAIIGAIGGVWRERYLYLLQ